VNPSLRVSSITASLSPPQKWTVGAAGLVASALLLTRSWDIRWFAGCLTFFVVAGVSASVAHLKGRKTHAAAGVGSVIVLGLLWAFMGFLLHASGATGVASYGYGLLFMLSTFWIVGPLLLIAIAGVVMRAKPDSVWAAAAVAWNQSRVDHVGLAELEKD